MSESIAEVYFDGQGLCCRSGLRQYLYFNPKLLLPTGPVLFNFNRFGFNFNFWIE